MAERKMISSVLTAVLVFSIHACTADNDKKEAVFKKLPEITEVRPQKPVKIKLRRNASGSYSWEITGDDADKIIEADKKLARAVKE
ncbi:MAG: hypothetical protein OEU95_06330 [Nitrospirota bacterium]|nr:hypothetical protein [Nitrospirota bacterium]